MSRKRAKKPEAARLDAALGRERPRLRAGATLSVISALLWMPQALLIAMMLSGLLTGTVHVTPPLAALGFFLVALARIGLNHLAEKRLFDAAEEIIAAERRAILAREARATSPSVIGGPGALAALMREKLSALAPYITRYGPAQTRTGIVPIVILMIAFSQSWAVGVVLLVAGPLIPVFMALVGWAAQEASEKQMAQIGSLNDLLVDRLAALADIRLLDATGRVTGDFEQSAEDLRSRTMAVLRIAFLSSTVLELFAALGVALVAVWVGFSLLDLIHWGAWGGIISPTAGIFLLLLTPDYFQPLRDLAAAWHDRADAAAVAADLVRYEAETPDTIVGTGESATPLPGAATIQWSGLTATRGDRRIDYPDAMITPGETVALTGASGTGKTTLLRLLAGLDAPSVGRIEVAGRLLDADTADSWRARLGWMPQTPHFLARSLAWNVGFGADLAPETLSGAVLDEVIATLPGGAETILGETGAGLSGGEARRVMLARATQAAPDVILADEPTADLDAETAARVTEGLLALAERGATLIVATHDPVLMDRLGRVIDLEAGS